MITNRNKYTMPKGNMRGNTRENRMDYRECGEIAGNGRFNGKVVSATAADVLITLRVMIAKKSSRVRETTTWIPSSNPHFSPAMVTRNVSEGGTTTYTAPESG